MEEDSDVSRIFEFSRQIGWSKHQLISLNPNNLILFVSIHHTNEAPSQLFNTSCNCIIDDRVTIEISIKGRLAKMLSSANLSINSSHHSNILTLL